MAIYTTLNGTCNSNAPRLEGPGGGGAVDWRELTAGLAGQPALASGTMARASTSRRRAGSAQRSTFKCAGDVSETGDVQNAGGRPIAHGNVINGGIGAGAGAAVTAENIATAPYALAGSGRGGKVRLTPKTSA